jgi:hypothetical protein
LETILRVGSEERARAILEQLLDAAAVGDDSPANQAGDMPDAKRYFDTSSMSQLERKFEATLQRVVVDDEDDDQTELASDFMRGHGDDSAAMVLRMIAKDAKIGLPRAVLDTMSDIISTTVSATQQSDNTPIPSAVTSSWLDVEWDSVYVGQPMLYTHRSLGRLEPCTLVEQLADAQVQVKFTKCGRIKTVAQGSLHAHDEGLLELPWNYWVAYSMDSVSSLVAPVELTVDGLQQRQLKAKYFSLKRQPVLRLMPASMRKNKRDQRSVLGFFDQHRRGQVVAFKMQEKDGRLSELQQRLRGTHTPAGMREIWAERRLEVHLSLTDLYLKARITALRRWTWCLTTVYGTSPWRVHVWPLAQDDDCEFSEDDMALGFTTESSMRYSTISSVRAAWTHIKEFHITILGVVPGDFPLTDHFVQKLRPVLLKENPEGRKDRPGYEPKVYNNMCRLLREYRDGAYENGDVVDASEYHEVLLAACAFYEPAARAGEFVPGDAWDPTRADWTKETTRCIQTGEGIADEAIAVLLPQPHRKTELMKSRVAQQRAKNPLVYIVDDDKHFLLYRAAQESQKFSPVDWSTARTEPAFRRSMVDSTPLSTDVVAGYLQAAHAELYPEEAAKYTFALHGARHGRIQSMKVAGGSSGQLKLMNLPGGVSQGSMSQRGVTQAPTSMSTHTEAVMNKVSGHTKSAGRENYDVSQLVDEIALLTAANSVEVLPMDTVHKFVRDGSGNNDAVSVVRTREGHIRVVKQHLSPLPTQTRALSTEKVGRSVMMTPAVVPVLKTMQAKAAAKKFAETTGPARTVTGTRNIWQSTTANTASLGIVTQMRKAGQLQTIGNTSRVPTVPDKALEGPPLPKRPVRGEVTAAQPSPKVVIPRARKTTVVASTATAKIPVGRLCEDCSDKSANYGLATQQFRRRWC